MFQLSYKKMQKNAIKISIKTVCRIYLNKSDLRLDEKLKKNTALLANWPNNEFCLFSK